MTMLRPPHAHKHGPEWTRSELRELLEWSAKEPQRTQIILRIVKKLAAGQNLHRRSYLVGEQDVQDFWSEFCLELWADFCSKIYVRMQGFNPEKGELIGFLTNRAAQLAADKERVRRQREVRLNRASQGGDVPLPGTKREADVETALLEELDSERLFGLLDEFLKPETAAIVRECYQDGKTAVEIAEERGLRPGTVRIRLMRARRRIKAAFDAQKLRGTRHDQG